jgi:hypothetical protein
VRDTRQTDVLAAFKGAEANLDRLQTQLGKTAQKLLQAGMDVAAIDKQIEAFATDTNADPSSAAHLVGERETARNVALLLEQAEAFLEGEVAKAKAGVIDAENACRAAQRATLQQQADAARQELLRAMAKNVQRLLRLINTINEVDAIDQPGGMVGRVHPEHLFGPLLQDMVKAVWPETESARDPLFPSPSEISAIDTRSSKVTDDERKRWRTGGHAALLPDDIEPAVNDDFDFPTAIRRLEEGRDQIAHHRSQVEHYTQKARTHPGDPNNTSYIERHTAEVERWERNVENMESTISARRQARHTG